MPTPTYDRLDHLLSLLLPRLTCIQVILEAYRASRPVSTLPDSHCNGNDRGDTSNPEFLLVSANTALSLEEQMKRIQGLVLSGSAPDTYDLAYTLNVRREKLPHRAYTVVQDGEILETSTLAKVPAKSQDVYLIFSGQGAQWAGMCSVKVMTERPQSLSSTGG